MAECCPPGDEASSPSKTTHGLCSLCGGRGTRVSTLTVKSLVRQHSRVAAAPNLYFFCRNRACDVVYFAEKHAFLTRDLKVRVGMKESLDPIPLCYCFAYTREDICRDMDVSGSSRILMHIKAEIRDGFCSCEVKNPSGTCCLGEIVATIQGFKKNFPAS